jgi:lipoate-protein ligase A
MRVYRGRAPTRAADRAATDAAFDRTAETGEPFVRAWAPHRQVAFGPRDRAADGYEAARAAAEERGYPPVERRVGGRAVAYAGTTVAFAQGVPVEDPRRGLDDRYEAATDALAVALSSLGVDARPGEPPEAFCPGSHSLQAGGKLAGVAQRVKSTAALVGGIVVVNGAESISGVLTAVYDALGVPFDPGSVGSVAAAGGPAAPVTVARAVEEALVGDVSPTVEQVDGPPVGAGDRET